MAHLDVSLQPGNLQRVTTVQPCICTVRFTFRFAHLACAVPVQ
jgi:hypothetical protein